MTWKSAAMVVLLAGAAACGGKVSSGLSVSTRTAVATQQGAVQSGGASAGLVLANGITLHKIRMVVREVKVEGGDATKDGACGTPGATSATGDSTSTSTSTSTPNGATIATSTDSGSTHEGDCSSDLKFGPYYVELGGDALKGAVSWAFDAPVPAGNYDEIDVRVDTIPAGMAGSDAGLAAMAAAGASIAVDGVLDAGTASEKPFSFRTPMEVSQKREGAVAIGGDKGTNVTLDFDPSGWFGPPGGPRLDPKDPANQGAILANIRASIRLVKDDDRDGCDDDGDATCHGGR